MHTPMNKKYTKFRSKHIWPTLAMLLLSIIAFMGIGAITMELFLIYVTSNHFETSYKTDESMVKIFDREMNEKDSVDISDTVNAINELTGYQRDICILNDEDEIIKRYGNSLPRLDRRGVLDIDVTYEIYAGQSKGIILNEKQGEVTIDIGKVIPGIFSDKEEFTSLSAWMQGAALSTEYWGIYPLTYDGYSITIKENMIISRKDFLYVFIIFTAIFIVSLIPLFVLFLDTISAVITQKKMSKLLYTDIETGGKNWIYFQNFGEKKIRKRKNRTHQFAVLDIQLEKYRNYCGCYGMQEGEKLIQELTVLFEHCAGNHGISCHYGKADFCLLLQYDTEDELNERIYSVLNNINSTRVHRLFFHVGISQIQALESKSNRSRRKLNIKEYYNNACVARASIASYTGNKIAYYNDEMIKEQLWERTVEEHMEEALLNKEFAVYYQPKYSTRECVVSGAEALVRWISPAYGFISPGRFIPIFERDGFIMKLDDYMLDAVAKQQTEWLAQGKKVVPISVNVSRAHFSQDNLAEHIQAVVDQYHVPHNVIELELTESAFFDDKQIIQHTVKQLQDNGFTVSMDDFGSGYSSLNSLKDLPLDVVKLDAEFFRETEYESRSHIVVEQAIALAKKLNMKIVAEGIETKDQVDFLTEQGCDLIQGFYFAKPMPTGEFEKEAFSRVTQ